MESSRSRRTKQQNNHYRMKHWDWFIIPLLLPLTLTMWVSILLLTMLVWFSLDRITLHLILRLWIPLHCLWKPAFRGQPFTCMTNIVMHWWHATMVLTVMLCDFSLQVSLLMLVEIGLFPLVCGWWLDVCSLVSDFLTSIKTTSTALHNIYPVTPRSLHWAVCMFHNQW